MNEINQELRNTYYDSASRWVSIKAELLEQSWERIKSCTTLDMKIKNLIWWKHFRREVAKNSQANGWGKSADREGNFCCTADIESLKKITNGENAVNP